MDVPNDIQLYLKLNDEIRKLQDGIKERRMEMKRLESKCKEHLQECENEELPITNPEQFGSCTAIRLRVRKDNKEKINKTVLETLLLKYFKTRFDDPHAIAYTAECITFVYSNLKQNTSVKLIPVYPTNKKRKEETDEDE